MRDLRPGPIVAFVEQVEGQSVISSLHAVFFLVPF